MEKKSVPKGLLMTVLAGRTDHPTAEMIYEDIKKIYPQIGLATVYRNLDKMVKKGLLHQINGPAGKRFDPDLSVHFHFCCEKCGRVEDIDFDGADGIIDTVQVKTDMQITGFYGEFRGLCRDCKVN